MALSIETDRVLRKLLEALTELVKLTVTKIKEK